jgi:hypothetical protein
MYLRTKVQETATLIRLSVKELAIDGITIHNS